MTHKRKLPALLAALLVSACAVGPDYHRPAVEAPSAYKEAGDWKPARPADDQPRGPWWSVYNDAVLDGLEQQVTVSNQNLKASEAAYRQAVAAVEEARANFFPEVDLNASAQRAGGGGKKAANALNAGVSGSWEPDLWGRIRRLVESQQAQAEASAADLASATLSEQGTLAIDYFELRAADQLDRLLGQTLDADAKSLQITQNQYAVGVVSKADVIQAQTQVDSVKSQKINLGIQRAQLEHAIAVLIGKAPAEFSLPPADDLPDPPEIPVGIPSDLLQRRPDIASAERQVASANAEIGVAESAYFPDITLAASEGFASAALGKLISASTNVWSVGPQLALTLFDGGAREAEVKEAKAAYDQQVALYRQTVLTAFQQVEDGLSSTRVLAQQADVQAKAVAEAEQATQILVNEYKAGTVVYTNVITVQNQELAEKQTALTIRQNRLTNSVQLIQALGGGWSAEGADGPPIQQQPGQQLPAQGAATAPPAPGNPAAAPPSSASK